MSNTEIKFQTTSISDWHIYEGIVNATLDVGREDFELLLSKTAMREEPRKAIMAEMAGAEIDGGMVLNAVHVNYLVNGDVTANINVNVSPAENSDIASIHLSDAEKETLKEKFDRELKAIGNSDYSLEHALLEAQIWREVAPLDLKDCYRFEDWTPIDADNGEILIRLSPSQTDLEDMVRRTPLWEQDYIKEMFSKTETATDLYAGDAIEVYAYIKPDNTVRAEIQPVQSADGEKFTTGDAAALPLTSGEQMSILDAVDIELAKNKITYRLSDKSTEELSDLLCAKINGEYGSFIANMQKQTIDVAIESAYEIVWKDNINEYCFNETPDLTPQQYIALLSSKNTLDEVYERILKDEYANSYDDIGIVLNDTADKILLSTEVTIKEQKCRPIDAWQEHGTSYLIGQHTADPSFYYASVMDGKTTREYEYDHKPSREDVISDHTDRLAEETIDRHEAEFGADGYRVFPDREEQEVQAHINAPLILHDFQKAQSLGEHGIDNFWQSREENKLCAKAIIAAKQENTTYGEMAGTCYFDAEKTVGDVLAKGFPQERLGYVIASQVVRDQNYLDNPQIIDGRFSREVKEWAIKTFSQQENFPFRNFEDCDITSAMHHTLVNSLAEKFIGRQLELSSKFFGEDFEKVCGKDFEKFFGEDAARVASIMDAHNITLTVQKEDNGCYNIIGESNAMEDMDDETIYFHLPNEPFNENDGFSTEDSLKVFIEEMCKMNVAPYPHHQINYFINDLNILDLQKDKKDFSQDKKETRRKSKDDMEH